MIRQRVKFCCLTTLCWIAATLCATASDAPVWQLDLSPQAMRFLAATAGDVNSPARDLIQLLKKESVTAGRCRVAGLKSKNQDVPQVLTVIEVDRPEIDIHAYLVRECNPTKNDPEIYFHADLRLYAAVRGSKLILSDQTALLTHPVANKPFGSLDSTAAGHIRLADMPASARPQSAALQNVEQISFLANTNADRAWDVTVDFHTTSPEQAMQTKSIIDGLIGFARIKQEKQRNSITKIAESAKSEINDAMVRITASITRPQLRATINPKPDSQVISHE